MKDGDTCDLIARAHSVTVNELLVSNRLGSCDFLPETGGTLCVRDKACTLYTVQEGDDCLTLTEKYVELAVFQFTQAQLVSWNGHIDAACSNLFRLVGQTICVSNPGGDYHPLVTTTVDPTPTTPAFV